MQQRDPFAEHRDARQPAVGDARVPQATHRRGERRFADPGRDERAGDRPRGGPRDALERIPGAHERADRATEPNPLHASAFEDEIRCGHGQRR